MNRCYCPYCTPFPGSGERQHNYGISIGADTRIQLHQRPYGIGLRGTAEIRDAIRETVLAVLKHPIPGMSAASEDGEATHKDNRFYPLPSDLKRRFS